MRGTSGIIHIGRSGLVRCLALVLALSLASIGPHVETEPVAGGAAPEQAMAGPAQPDTATAQHHDCGPTPDCTPVLLSPGASWTHVFAQRPGQTIRQTQLTDLWRPATVSPIPISVA